MNTSADFPLIRWSVLLFGASATVSAVLIYSSSRYASAAQGALSQAQSSSKDARQHLNAAREDKENMAIYASEYGKLVSRKMIGEESRLDWIENLEQLRKRNLITDFTYNITPQKSYMPQPTLNSGNFDIRYSEMKLNLDLLHEEQLLNFFNALHLQSTGWYQLDSCTLRSLGGADIAAQTNVKAECTGGWITLKNRNAKS